MGARIDPINGWLVDEMRQRWEPSPESVDPAWRALFESPEPDERRATSWERPSGVASRAAAYDVASTLVIRALRPVGAARLDVHFVIDTTGRSPTAVGRLRVDVGSIARQIDCIPSRPDVRFGATVYRRVDDGYLTRTVDFVDDVEVLRRALADVLVGVGPSCEAHHVALEDALDQLSWRRGGTMELLVLGSDAPPLRGCDSWLAHTAVTTGSPGRRVRVLPSDRSADEPGVVTRQLAFAAGGQFVFIGYGTAEASDALAVGRLLDEEILAVEPTVA